MRHFSASLQAFAAGALFLTTGCAPSVYTSIQKSYPARIEGSTVLVYDMADSLPEPAEVLGSVTVKDSGFSVNCNYAKVMQRAKDETNKIGGNGLHLFWHKEPSVLGSSCHRIAAHMLLLPDSVYTASYFDNVAAQNARLAAKLTGWKIDIKPVSAPSDEEPEDEEDVLLDDGAETEE